jgi:hypothetical protein
MSELKTKQNDASVFDFLNAVENEQRKKDAFTILEMMSKASAETPKMWGGSIVGFGLYAYKYASGREGDWMKIGFSPRKQSMSLYLMCGLEALQPFLTKLGKHKTGKGCLYINKLTDIDLGVLEEMIEDTLKRMDISPDSRDLP